MYPWPKCISCLEPMPVLANGKKVEVHSCRKCEKIVVVEGNKESWFTGIFTLKEISRQFPLEE